MNLLGEYVYVWDFGGVIYLIEKTVGEVFVLTVLINVYTPVWGVGYFLPNAALQTLREGDHGGSRKQLAQGQLAVKCPLSSPATNNCIYENNRCTYVGGTSVALRPSRARRCPL